MTRAAAEALPQAQTTDQVRSYWRSVITATCMRHAGLLGIVPVGTTELGKLPHTVLGVATARCHALLDAACREEAASGVSRRVAEQRINAALWNLLKLYKPAVASPVSRETNAIHGGNSQ